MVAAARGLWTTFATLVSRHAPAYCCEEKKNESENDAPL
jgi:hypothetical protein